MALDTVDLRWRQLYEDDLYSYTVKAWHAVEPGRQFVTNWHIEAICEHLQAIYDGQLKDVIFNVPPRHMKSLLVNVFFPTWWWTKRPGTKWLMVAHGRNLVLRDSGKARRLIKSPWYQGLWGDKYQILEDQDAKGYFENTAGGARVSNSLDAGVTGEGGDVLCIDDPLNIQDANNPGAIERVNEIWDSTLYSRVNDIVTSPRILIMQRLNENDLTGHLLAEEKGWTHFYLPARYEPKRKCVTFLSKDLDENDRPVPTAQPFFWDPRQEPDELLFPERFPKKEVDALERKGENIFYGQQQQRPSKAGGTIFQKKWWQYYSVLPEGIEELMDACQSWDCAFKDLKTSSYVVGTVWARYGTSIYLLYRYRDRADITATMQAIEMVSNTFPWVGPKLVEDKANGPAVIALMKNKVAGLIPYKRPGPETSKEGRAIAVSYMVQAQNVFIPNPELNPWVKEFIDECAVFPNGRWNDQVDSMTQALAWYEERPVVSIPIIDLLQEGQNELALPQQVF